MLRRILHAISGLIIFSFFAIWFLRIRNYSDFKQVTYVQISTVLSLMFISSLSMIISSHFSCVNRVMLVLLAGRIGKSFLFALLCDHMLDGPLSHIIPQIRIFLRCVKCFLNFLFRIGKIKTLLITYPIIQMLMQQSADPRRLRPNVTSASNANLQPVFRMINKITNPNSDQDILDLDYYYSSVNDSDRGNEDNFSDIKGNEANYTNTNTTTFNDKLAEKCEQLLQRASGKCMQVSQILQRQCKYYTIGKSVSGTFNRFFGFFSVIYGLFQGKLFTNLCGYLQSCVDQACSSLVNVSIQHLPMFNNCRSLTASLIPSMTTVNKNIQEQIKNIEHFADADLTVHVENNAFCYNSSDIVNHRHPKTLFTEFGFTLQHTGRVVEQLMKVIRICAGYFGALLLIEAYLWLNHYLNDITFENAYSKKHSKYFKQLDDKRRKLNKLTVTENLLHLHPRLFRVNKRTVKQNGLIVLTISGQHSLGFKVEGVGSLANLIRRTLSSTKSNFTVNQAISSKFCLPEQSFILPATWYILFCCNVIGIYVLSFASLFTGKLCILTAASYYPDRERQRNLWLYNRLLKEIKIKQKFESKQVTIAA
ncbi:hypothetical protein GJ496_004069 [Pomphorhynchus laevis]|nr:hypothetical protein GJ496_004069 [Pomphorhynchus laevis]